MLQLEQEFNLILERTDMFTKAIDDWCAKWVPAILIPLLERKLQQFSQYRKNMKVYMLYVDQYNS